ncbi:hypothetical protein ACTOWA_02780 [Herbaspirillum seropedicae]|uniref:hypothetical protein n=1 Tax=Herbaspirillum seropedicae TaxID=964 RepID=UPI003F8CFF7E
MKNFLNRSIRVKSILGWLSALILAVFAIYAYFAVRNIWIHAMGGISYKDSPYFDNISSECYQSASRVGYYNNKSIVSGLKLEPAVRYYSLPQSEKVFGKGMKGLPCLGAEFLVLLHANNYTAVKKFVDENGNVIAEITFKVVRQYKEPVPQSVWSIRDSWPNKGGAEYGLVEIEMPN